MLVLLMRRSACASAADEAPQLRLRCSASAAEVQSPSSSEACTSAPCCTSTCTRGSHTGATLCCKYTTLQRTVLQRTTPHWELHYSTLGAVPRRTSCGRSRLHSNTQSYAPHCPLAPAPPPAHCSPPPPAHCSLPTCEHQCSGAPAVPSIHISARLGTERPDQPV